MAEYQFGFIGTGNMGGALATAVCRAADPSRVILANRTAARAQDLAARLGCASGNNIQAARDSEYLFLGVKPQMMQGLMSEISPVLRAREDRFVLVTMAAGVTIQDLCIMAGGEWPVVRIMPNTPVSVGQGVILYAAGDPVTREELDTITSALSGAGLLDPLPESLMDAGTALSGCGPAFVCQFAEALADAGVQCGLPRDKALRYAAQTLAGTARLMLDSGKHPAVLKDEVCSPGGSTIAGVHALESGGLRGTVMDAVLAAWQRTAGLGK